MAGIDTDVAADVAQSLPEEEVRICLFSMSGDYYAVTVDVLAEIIITQKVFPVPTTPSHVLGIINLRGNIVPIVDIRPALSLPQLSGINQIAIVNHERMIVGIVVDAVSEVIAVPRSSVLPLPAEISTQDAGIRRRSRFLRAVIQKGDTVAALLDIDRLFEAIKLS